MSLSFDGYLFDFTTKLVNNEVQFDPITSLT